VIDHETPAGPAENASDVGAPRATSRRRRLIVIGVAIVTVAALAIGSTIAISTAQAQQAAAARADEAAALAAAVEADRDAAIVEARTLADAIDAVLEVLATDENLALIEVDLEALQSATEALDDAFATADEAHQATAGAVRELNLLLRSVAAQVRELAGTVSLASESERDDLERALLALAGAPFGLPSSYENRDELVADALDAARTAAASHDTAAAATGAAPSAGSPSSGGGTGSGGGTSGGSGGGTGGGGSGGGSTGGGGDTPPPPHPRAALCESLGFGANGASCLANTPTYVATNASYVDWATCSAAGAAAYGSHTPGFGGTSRPSYTQPWSYQLVYASSGLGTVYFYLCDM